MPADVITNLCALLLLEELLRYKCFGVFMDGSCHCISPVPGQSYIFYNDVDPPLDWSTMKGESDGLLLSESLQSLHTLHPRVQPCNFRNKSKSIFAEARSTRDLSQDQMASCKRQGFFHERSTANTRSMWWFGAYLVYISFVVALFSAGM